MKNLYHLLAGGIVLSVLVLGCTQEMVNSEVDITSVRCSISQIDVEEDFATGILDTLTATKASFSGANFIWSIGDRIGIIPNTGSQIYFAVNDGAGTSTAAFDGGDWAMKSTGTFYAYYPLYPDIFLTKDHVSVSYTGQTQNGNNNNLHTGDFWTLYTEGTTAVGNALNFSFNHLTSFFKTYVTVPAGTYTKITFSAPSEVFIKDGYFDLSAQTPTIVGTTMTDELSLNLQGITFAEETELTGYLVVAPVDITGIPITVTVYKDDAATYEYTLTKTSPMVPAKTYAFRATALTQLASSVSQANTLFASGATAVTITEPLTENATVVLPNTTEAVTLILPTTTSSSKLTVSYDQGASSYPATLAITGPEGADLDIQTPNSTVTVNGVAYHQITSRTAANTCIIPAGVTVTTLKVIQGGVQVYGTVSQIDLSEQEDDAIINVSGTVTSLLGEDGEEYTLATGVSLNKPSINLNVGDTKTLTATVAPVGAYPNVVWTSSDEAVATVSSAGVVTAVAAGSATIMAKTISGGFTASCEITVEHDSANDYFTITSTGNTGVAIVYHNSPSAISLEYKKGDDAWTPYTIIDYHDFYDNNVRVGDVIELADGESLQFRAGESGNQSFSQFGSLAATMQRYYNVIVDGEGTIDVSGNIMSLVDRTLQRTTLESYMFHGLFHGCTKLVDASHLILPSTTLAGCCYLEMFHACTNLTSAPNLPATTLATSCYYGMFDSCINLTNAPDLPATVLANSCYEGMFYWCQSLIEAPLLPATTLANGCYRDMFYGCSNLRYVKAYYTTYLSGDSWSTSNWLSNVASTGTFVKHSASKWDIRGGNGIPEGWSIEYDDVDLGLPSVGDVVTESVAYRTVTVQSSLTSDSHEITNYGFYYGTSANAITTRKNATSLNAGVFSKEITGLNPGTTYYVKAYATNEAGTVESDVISFTTRSLAYIENGHNCGDGIEIVQNVGNDERTVIWSPVNLGYYDTSDNNYNYGRFYQWGRVAGQGYAMNMITTASGDIYTYTDERGKTVHVKVNHELPLTTPDPNTHYARTDFTYWDEDDECYYDESLPYWNGNWNQAFNGNWNTLEKDDYIGNPCPDGWRIPTSAELSGLIVNKSSFITVSNQKGYYFYGLNSNGNRVFFPASGQGGPNPEAIRGTTGRYWTNMSSQVVIDGGEYWIYRQMGYYLQLDSSGASLTHEEQDLYSTYQEDNRAMQIWAFSIRCVKEE